MNNQTIKAALAATLLAALPALAAGPASVCGDDASTAGLKARIRNLNMQMDRIQWSTDRGEQKRLLELHTKLMHEGMQQLRVRKTTPACRLEMTHAMMDQIIRHQLVEQEFTEAH